MKFGSVCSGVEAASLAWMPLGWECKFVSEIEPFPCAVLQHRFGASAPINQLDPNEIIITDEEWVLIDELKKVNKDWMKACDNADLISRFKERKQREAWIKDNALLNKEGKIPNEGDFTKIGKKYAGQIDLLVGGTPCFVAGTMVLTPSGYVPIESLNVGDDIVSGSGKLQKVEAIGGKDADIVKVFVKGRKPLYCTADHQFYCVDSANAANATDADFRKVMVSEAVGKCIGGLPSSVHALEAHFSTDYTQFVQCKNRKAYVIERFEKHGKGRVFNITVSEEHHYIAEGLWSANCQDLSIAGKRAGFDGERSSLAIDFVRLAYESQCKWFVWENVPGVFSSNEGRDFATLLSLFTGSKVEVPKDGWGTAGFVCNARRDRYGVAWRTLDGQFTRTQRFPFAVPQRRRRVFVVGYFGDWTRAAEVLLEPGRSKWDTPSRFKAREIFAEIARADSALADRALRGTGEGSTDCFRGSNPGAFVQDECSGTIKVNVASAGNSSASLVTNLCGSGKVNATFWNGNDVAECLKANCDRDRMPDKGKLPCVIERNEVAATLTASYADKMGLENQHIDQGAPNFIISAYNGAGDESGEITPTLQPYLGKLLSNQTPVICRATQQSNAEIMVDACPTITEAAGTSGNNQPIICLNNQGGSVMSVESDGNAGTLSNEQIVCGDFVQTLKTRSGCEGGGKGALVQDELSATLGCGNDQTLFVVHGAQTPINNEEEYANPLGCCNDGLENVISMHNKQFGQCEENLASTLLSTDYKEPQIVCYDNQTRARNPMPTGDVSCTMQAAMGQGGNNVPLVQCFDARGNGDGSVSSTATGDHLNRITDFTPVVHECYAVDKRNQTLDAKISNTLNTCTGGDNYGTIMQECYAIDSMGSNAMKSSNPYSGFHKEEIAKTLDTTDPNPTKNQGGNVIVDAVAVAENIIGRADHNGGNGVGAQEELAYTQNATGVMGVCTKGNGDAFENDVHTSLTASGGGQAGQGYPCARINSTVRRLLPIETERLMGFPDNHTRIPWKGLKEEDCPDSPRYKACGNSMCVNVMQWIGEQIERVEKQEKIK